MTQGRWEGESFLGGEGARRKPGKGRPHRQTPLPTHTAPHPGSPLAPARQGDPPVSGGRTHPVHQMGT